MPDGNGEGPLRPFWSGTLAFGLVSVPVNLYPANASRRPSLRMVDRDGTPLARRYFCPAHDREISRDEIVRGFETEEGEMVVVTDEELEALAPEKTREIDLRRFVDVDEIDPLFFQRAYLLAPAEGSVKAYRLLAATMERTGRAGVATFVMRGKEYLVAILARDGVLKAETMRFAEEVRTPEDVGVEAPPEPDPERVDALRRAVRGAAAEELDESELEDPYRERLLALVDAKLREGEDVARVPVAEETGAGDADGRGRVIDLMAALRRSLAESGMEARKPPARAGRTRSRDGGTEEEDRLRGRTRRELYERARELGIPGRSSMNKDELVEAIRSA